MSKRLRKHEREELDNLQTALQNNGRAMQEGPRKKTWTRHDLKNIKPLTPAQEDMFHDFMNGFHICAHGSAGTGKTFIALWLAFNELLNPESKATHIIIVRSAVPTRDLGFMPGDLEEKTAFYEMPYRDMLASLFGKFSTYDNMKEAKIIRFLTTSFIRGLTWDNAIVVVDEGQNMTFHEINSIMTRLGDNTKLIFTGDLIQTDLRKSSQDKTGMDRFVDVIKNMKNEFACVQFTTKDIVRSRFVKAWIEACEATK